MTGRRHEDADGWLAVLEEARALTRGHFRLSSGLHSPADVQCARLTEEPRRARRAGEALAAALVARLGAAPDSVLAPAMGGLLIGHEVAAALGVPFRFTERAADGAMALRRGFTLAAGERVVVVEDVVTTGRSTRETIELAEARGARVVGVGALLDRSGGGEEQAPFAVPFVALARLDLPTWRPEECPRCAAGEAVEKPGSRPDARPR
jgi:orotate phosphoribosyltransferase